MSGALGALLIDQIAKTRNKKAILIELKLTIGIIEKYLTYIKEHPDDRNMDLEELLELAIIEFNKLK